MFRFQLRAVVRPSYTRVYRKNDWLMQIFVIFWALPGMYHLKINEMSGLWKFYSRIFILACLIHCKEGQVDLVATLYVQEVPVFGFLREAIVSNWKSTSAWTSLDTQPTVHCHTPEQTAFALYLHHNCLCLQMFKTSWNLLAWWKLWYKMDRISSIQSTSSCGRLEAIRSVLITSLYGKRKILIMPWPD
jgi:hypothetical protein